MVQRFVQHQLGLVRRRQVTGLHRVGEAERTALSQRKGQLIVGRISISI